MGNDRRWRPLVCPWNRGQQWSHWIDFAALETDIAAWVGKLGYNVKFIFETGKEISSPGLNAVCAAEADALRADMFLASDGPRVSAHRPTLFLGSRGSVRFELLVDLREGGHHSGTWGGVLRNSAVVLSHALATLVDRDERIIVKELRPPPISAAVRNALADFEQGRDESLPRIDPA